MSNRYFSISLVAALIATVIPLLPTPSPGLVEEKKRGTLPAVLDQSTIFNLSASVSGNNPGENKLESTVKNESLPRTSSKKESDDANTENDDKEVDSHNFSSRFTVTYSSLDEARIAENFYHSASIDYNKLFYGPTSSTSARFQFEDDYWGNTANSDDTDAECLDNPEAQKALADIQYATIVGATHEIDSETRRKFDMWIKFNPDLFKMYETNTALTREVNYKPLT